MTDAYEIIDHTCDVVGKPGLAALNGMVTRQVGTVAVIDQAGAGARANKGASA